MPGPYQWIKSLRGWSKSIRGANPEYSGGPPDPEIPTGALTGPLAAAAQPAGALEPAAAERKSNFVSALRSMGSRMLAEAISRKRSGPRIVTLSTEKDALRVVVFQGNNVVAWGSADPSYQPEAPGRSPVGDSPEQAPDQPHQIPRSPLESILSDLELKQSGRLWSLLDRIGIRRGRAVMDLSLYTTLTRQLQVPRVKGRYLEPVVLSEVLESLPFAREEVEIAWQVQQRNAEDDSIFAVAMPRQRLDDQVTAARAAGLIPAAAYSKSAALASVSGVSNGIVIQLETSDAALVLVQDGYPKTVHEVEYGTDDSSLETKANNLARAFGQVASYYQPADPQDRELPVRELPVIITGLTGETDKLTQLLREKIQRRTLSIDPPLQYPENFPVDEYAINIGLFLTDQLDRSRENKGSRKSLALNLLPKRHLPNALPVLQAAVFLILILLAVHPINIMGKVEAKILEKDSVSSEVSLLRGQQRRLTSALSSFQENQAELEVVSRQADNLDTQLDTLKDRLTTFLNQISTITRVASAQDISLTGVTPRGTEGFSLGGSAGSHAELLTYVQTLRDDPLFEDALVLNVGGTGGADPSNDGEVTFSVQVTKAKPVEGEAAAEADAEGAPVTD